MDSEMNQLEARVKQLEEEIRQLKRQWPRHSVPPALVIQFEDLEDALAQARAALQANAHEDSSPPAPSA